MDFNYKKSGTIFNMHSYWTKQPLESISYFIEKYSKENDIVFDPFSGTGMTGVASLILKRNAILSDISPVSLHISKGYCTNFQVKKNNRIIREEINKISKKLHKYFKTKCPKCGGNGNILFCIVGEEWADINGSIEKRGELFLKNIKINKNFKYFRGFRLLKVCYQCNCTKDKMYKEPDLLDINLFNTNEFKKYFYPQDNFFGQEPKRNYKRGIKKIYQLYSPRNLTTLAILFNEINKIKEEKIRQLFLFAFTSILFNTSLMSRYRPQYENTSIKMGTFYIPPLIKDNNVLSSFLNKLKLIMQGNELIFSNNNENTVRILKDSALKMENIKANSIDYIYTDPPYSDILSYSELNIVYESWLKEITDNKEELIVSKEHNKTIFDYSKGFTKFMDNSYRVLKNGKYMTIVFHNANIEHWYYFQKAITETKFKGVASELPIRLISNSKTASQHKTNKKSQCFLIFNFQKDVRYKKQPLINLEPKEYQELVLKYKIEAKNVGYITDSDIFDYIINKIIFNFKINTKIKI